MMGRQRRDQHRLFYEFHLDDRIPKNHLLRRIDVIVAAALADLHKELEPHYSDIGRPSIDPELMLRMLIVGYCYGIRSERRLCEEVELHLAYRWFCKLDLEDEIPARRIYIAGLSAGGAAAATMGETYPDLYAAVGVHSGLACGAARDLSSAFAAMSGHGPARGNPSGVHTRRWQALPTIVFHGDRDTTVHPRNGTEVIARANTGEHSDASVEREMVCSGRRYTRSIQRDAGGRSVLEQWELHGAGHAWSGGNLAGSFTDPKGPDATKEMLRFFLEHVQSAPHSGDRQ